MKPIPKWLWPLVVLVGRFVFYFCALATLMGGVLLFITGLGSHSLMTLIIMLVVLTAALAWSHPGNL